jgi:molybdopterin converting factor subunit 1
MQIRLLYFASVRDLVGKPEEQLDLPDAVRSVSELLKHLQAIHPTLQGRLASVRVALNEEFAGPQQMLSARDVVALIPPVAGG